MISSELTLTATGLYWVNASMYIAVLNQNQGVRMQIHVNGTTILRGSLNRSTSNSMNGGCAVAGLLNIAANDKVTAYLYLEGLLSTVTVGTSNL